jgi:hypothetical protein
MVKDLSTHDCYILIIYWETAICLSKNYPYPTVCYKKKSFQDVKGLEGGNMSVKLEKNSSIIWRKLNIKKIFMRLYLCIGLDISPTIDNIEFLVGTLRFFDEDITVPKDLESQKDLIKQLFYKR